MTVVCERFVHQPRCFCQATPLRHAGFGFLRLATEPACGLVQLPRDGDSPHDIEFTFEEINRADNPAGWFAASENLACRLFGRTAAFTDQQAGARSIDSMKGSAYATPDPPREPVRGRHPPGRRRSTAVDGMGRANAIDAGRPAEL